MMIINTRLLKILLVLASASFLAMLGGIAFQNISGQSESLALTVAAMATSGLMFASLLGMWIYWIYYLWRTNQSTGLLLCFLLPYIYAVYRTIRALRTSPEASGAPRGA